MKKELTTEEKIKRQYIIVVNLIIFFILLFLAIIFRFIYLTYIEPNKVLNINSISNIEYDPNIDMAETIIEVRNTLSKYYNVDISYDATTYSVVNGVNAEIIIKDKTILDMLKTLNNILERYPREMFDEISNVGYKVTIYLVDHFNNDNIALANRTATGRFNIFISNDVEIEKALHHEIYHIFEYYMKLESDMTTFYASWIKQNPDQFFYLGDVTKLNGAYVFGKDFSGQPLAFITVYSKYSDVEDRAETFSEMMINNTDFRIIPNTHFIQSKMNLIAEKLMNVFTSLKDNQTTFYLERLP